MLSGIELYDIKSINKIFTTIAPIHKLIYSLAMCILEVKQMSEHIYETRIMNAWYDYDGPMSFEQFYASYIPA